MSSQLRVAPSLEPGVALDGRFELIEHRASGAVGEVWRALDWILQRDVAIKILHPAVTDENGLLAAFRLEAHAAARMDHPGVVKIFDLVEADAATYIVMEYVDGPTLAEARTPGPMSCALVLAVGVQVASGLGDAHRSGIVHRDVALSNIMLTRNGFAKLVDFGGVRLRDIESDLTHETIKATLPRHLAPEDRIWLRRDPRELHPGALGSPRADVYALGALMWELLTGQLHAEETPPPLGEHSDLPPALCEAIDRATAADPRDRFHDGEDMARALAGLMVGRPEDHIRDFLTL